MTLEISVKFDTKPLRRHLKGLQKQIPFAASKAINDTAKDVKKALEAQIPKKLNKPTPFTQNAIGIKFSNKRSLKASVFVKPIQEKYLRWQIEGGIRSSTRKRIGVPVRAKLNQFGNIPGRRKGLVKGKKQFIATINGVTGVWQRTGGKRNRGVKLMVVFKKSVKYSKRFPFYRIANQVVKARIDRRLREAIRYAIKTAR